MLARKFIYALFLSLCSTTLTFHSDLSAFDEKDVVIGTNEAQVWLDLVDKGKYAESWDEASFTLKLTMKKEEWVAYLEKMRRPLGSVVKRVLGEQRTAESPPGVPAGDYLVLAYTTAFTNNPQAKELVILIHASDGKWRPISYFVDTKK